MNNKSVVKAPHNGPGTLQHYLLVKLFAPLCWCIGARSLYVGFHHRRRGEHGPCIDKTELMKGRLVAALTYLAGATKDGVVVSLAELSCRRQGWRYSIWRDSRSVRSLCLVELPKFVYRQQTVNLESKSCFFEVPLDQCSPTRPPHVPGSILTKLIMVIASQTQSRTLPGGTSGTTFRLLDG
jgi:hypothetical protein